MNFYAADVCDRSTVSEIFERHNIGAVINFAGHKAVGESVQQPLDYYANNLNCAISLLQTMGSFNVKRFIFSSSAAVYGKPGQLPIPENAGLDPQNPYGRTKQYIEEMLRDTFHADPSCQIAILRYFNPVGAHPGGLIGERPDGIPNNLVPFIAQVAAGERQRLSIFGGDYDTPDGTGVRDYIHVMDLARGHVNALGKLQGLDSGKLLTLNLGTGRGNSVLEILKVFEEVSGRYIPFDIVARREGDVAACYADPGLAKAKLDWHAKLGIYDMCRDAWNWQIRPGNQPPLLRKRAR